MDAIGAAAVKVILETGYLTDSEIIAASILSVMAGARFVKTSTGFSGSGATVHHVSLMKSTVGARRSESVGWYPNSSNCQTNVTGWSNAFGCESQVWIC